MAQILIIAIGAVAIQRSNRLQNILPPNGEPLETDLTPWYKSWRVLLVDDSEHI